MVNSLVLSPWVVTVRAGSSVLICLKLGLPFFHTVNHEHFERLRASLVELDIFPGLSNHGFPCNHSKVREPERGVVDKRIK